MGTPIKRMSKKKRILLKRILFETQKNCAYCNKFFEKYAEITLDHIVAKIHGGSDELDNLTLCCFDCNFKKGHRSVKKFKKLLNHLGP